MELDEKAGLLRGNEVKDIGVRRGRTTRRVFHFGFAAALLCFLLLQAHHYLPSFKVRDHCFSANYLSTD
jgi:hypothetical protein